MAMLHVVNPDEKDKEDKMRKVSSFMEFFSSKYARISTNLSQCAAVHEKIVKSKHRAGICQYKKQNNKEGHKAVGLWQIFKWIHLRL